MIDPADPAVLRVRLANGGSEAVTGTVDVTNGYVRLYTLRNDLDREAAIENLVQSVLRQRDEVAVIDRQAPSALITARQMIDMAKHRGVDFLSDRIFERRDGRLVAVTE
ncbi:hypothetical protein ACC680_31510 [Rhizobium ruizarguesonis]